MNLPVLPPTLLSVFCTVDAAPVMIEPPELVTLDRPCDAFDVIPEAVSFAFDAVSLAVSLALAAVSAVVEACLIFCRRRTNRDWRSSARVAGGAGMAAGSSAKLTG